MDEKQSFLEFLGEINGSKFTDDCAGKLLELVKAIEMTGKDGAMTLTLKFSRNDDGTQNVKASVAIKKPEPTRGRSVFFVHKNGLYASHPNQTRMFDEKNTNVVSITESKPRIVGDDI
jgi:hypothetical protein